MGRGEKHKKISLDSGSEESCEKGSRTVCCSVSSKLLGFMCTFSPQYGPLGTERSSRAELPCGALRRQPRKFDEGVTSSPPFKTLSRVFGWFMWSFYCHKKGGFESRMLSFHENNIMSKQKENKIPLACETQICHYKKTGFIPNWSSFTYHVCIFGVFVWVCVCVCCVCCVCLCVVYSFMCMCIHICVYVCVYMCVCIYI